MKPMKDIYTTTTTHRSIRSYKPDMVPNEDLQMILEAAIHAPTSVNGQQWSVIVVKDKETKNKVAHLAGLANGPQQWIDECPVFLLFVMDYYKLAKRLKAKGQEFGHIHSIEATMVGCVDVGIAFSNAMNVAEAMGYGIVPIGAVRAKPREMAALFNLPKGTYPILGMCLGTPNQDPGMKPRMTFDAVVHQEKYNQHTDEMVEAYDKVMEDYMEKRTNGQDIRSWSDTSAMYYAKPYYPFEKETLKEQGFSNEV